MRVRVTKRGKGKGTQVQHVGGEDMTSLLPEEVGLLRYVRNVETYEPAKALKGSGLRVGGRLVYLRDNGDVVRTSLIEVIDWLGVEVTGCEIVTVNSRYLVEAIKSADTPTDPRRKRVR